MPICTAQTLLVPDRFADNVGVRSRAVPAPTPPDETEPPAVDLRDVGIRRDGRWLLRDVTWRIGPSDRWVVLGPNGSGKSTLLDITSLWLHPTVGTVRVLGEELGRCDVRPLRARIGVVSAALADRLRPTLTVADLVVTGLRGDLETWWHAYTDDDRARAAVALDRAGASHLAERTFGTLSSGERQRVQLARTLVTEPALLLLDEPAAGLDLGAREDLVARLTDLAADPTMAPLVLVTHHVEEIPAGFTHALLLRDGGVVAAGPIDEVLREDTLGTTFGLPVRLATEDGRWRAWARTD
jgi:iron complex transport system ATP-binding protein